MNIMSSRSWIERGNVKLVYLLFSIALAGCTSGELTPQIREGMTKQEVVSILGNPDSFQCSGEYEGLRYTQRLISGWSWSFDRTAFSVILKDGRVVEYGAGHIRQRDPDVNTLLIVPVDSCSHQAGAQFFAMPE